MRKTEMESMMTLMRMWTVNRERIQVDIISTWKSFYVFFSSSFVVSSFFALSAFHHWLWNVIRSKQNSKFVLFSGLDFAQSRHNGFLLQNWNNIERKHRRTISTFQFLYSTASCEFKYDFIHLSPSFFLLFVSIFAIHFYVGLWMGDTLVNATKR